ncbi:MAG: hypothetical protein JWO91_3187 [Acidobacteriaceae bacterium]|jgi:hypothetical protein|nr:hypothetical protein [Acidobacteriaceae bacterium]
MKLPFIVLTLLYLFLVPLWPVEKADAQTDASSNAAATSSTTAIPTLEQKFQHIEENGRSATPDQTPTEFTEKEINDYIASGKVKLPAGMQSVVFRGKPGVITGTARVDFDEMKIGRNSANPLLSVFNGIHNVVVVAQAYGAGGQGMVHVESVSLDDVEIPRFVLQMFVDKYLKPKYPNIGLDSKFALPDRLDTASVGLHTLTVTQK